MNDVTQGDAGKKSPVLVAVDLGAESCRVSLLRWSGDQPDIRLVHRFPNSAANQGTGLRWNLAAILRGVEEGLRACAQIAPAGIDAIGVDGWAVDYVRLNAAGKPVADPFCYRDERNAEAQRQVHSRISPERLYQLTGVQILPLNTLYQLNADRRTEQNLPWINLPEFILHHLGGRRVSEYTNATHTQLLAARKRAWSPEIFTAAELDLSAAPVVVEPGTDLGRMQGELASLPAFRNTRLIAPACHDTASAIAGIPDRGSDWAFISSGTWSLVGCVLESACVSEAARTANFSNQGGVGGRIYFLKNVNGMWLLRQCMEHWRSQGEIWTIDQLIEASSSFGAPDCVLDVDDPALLLPGDMPARISAQLRSMGQDEVAGPESAGRMTNLILHSLAARYAAVLRDAARITGNKFERLYIVGGGSRNARLNQLTANATALKVLTGSAESATVGNFAIQMSALEGSFTPGTGVTANAVARWASVLADRSFSAPEINMLENAIPAPGVAQLQPPTGKALV